MVRRIHLFGVLGLGVAIGAFAAIPALHLIGHEDDHTHVGGAIVHHSDHDHDHDDKPTESDAPSKSAPGSHGAQSLAHFGAALLEVEAPPVVEAVVAPEPRREVPHEAAILAPIRTPRQARGPPLF